MKGVSAFARYLLILLIVMFSSADAGTITFGPPETPRWTEEVTIPWTADEGVVGMALTVDATEPIVEVVIAGNFFDVFVDSAFSAGSGYTVGDGTPIATQEAPGPLLLPATNFSICFAGLDDDGIGTGTDEAPTSGAITLRINWGSNPTVRIDIDTLRGGIVGYNGAMSVVGLPIEVQIEPHRHCWGPCKPHGDYNLDGLITAIDVQGLLSAWAPNPYDVCADFNYDGMITAIDVQILLNSWGKGCPE